MRIAVVSTGRVTPAWQALFARLSQSHDIETIACPTPAFDLTGWFATRALRSAIAKRGRFDVVHGIHADPAGLLAARVARRSGIPSLVSCDSDEFVSLPNIRYGAQRTRRGRRWVSEACTLATRVHVCSRFMAALAHARGIQTTVIPLTAITSNAATIKWLPSYRQKDSFRLIQVGTLNRLNNQRLAIDALRIVREKVNARLDLVGADALHGELQRHAATIGVADHVTFHGRQDPEQVHSLLSHADLYVQSTLHEAAGVAVLEAAAHGVPAVGTLTGYVADWSPTKAVAVGDAIPESLADAIAGLCADADRRRSLASLARTFSIAHDAAWAASQFDRLYRSLA